MHSNIKLAGQKLRGKIRRIDKGRMLYTAFLIPTALAMTPLQAHAAGETIWSKASEIMQDVYTQILGISTIAAIVTASIALLLMNFSKSGRTVDESRAWLKRIIITWAIHEGKGATHEEEHRLPYWRHRSGNRPLSHRCQYHPLESGLSEGF